MTRREILNKYNVKAFISPAILDCKLTDEEAKDFEKSVQNLSENFEYFYKCDEWEDVDDIDIETYKRLILSNRR